jgi:hypothetical protein
MTFQEQLKSTISRLAVYRGLNAGVTGGPSTGKTTQIQKFSEAGFPVLNEMALVLLDEAVSFCEERGLKLPDGPGLADAELIRLFQEHQKFHPLVDNPAFQSRLCARQLAQEAPWIDRSHKQLVVKDRTYIDILGYSKLYGVEPPEGIFDVKPPPSERLDVCYYLEPHGKFEATSRRVEKAEDGADFAMRLGPLLFDSYADSGVPRLRRVPSFKDLKKDDAILAKQEFIWTDLTKIAEELLREFEK